MVESHSYPLVEQPNPSRTTASMAVALMEWPPPLGQPDQESSHQKEDEDQPPLIGRDLVTVQNLKTPLLQLPPEILYEIFAYLPALDLARLSETCRILAQHANNDLLWANLVNANLLDPIHDPGIFDSFRTLYITHHPCWFIPRHKLWFSDTEHTGNLILTRYDNRRGVIEGYRVTTERRSHKFQVWEYNPDVVIQAFEPKVSLWLDDPILLLQRDPEGRRRYLNTESRMAMPIEVQYIFNAISLCQPGIPDELTDDTQWPPPNIPSEHRVYRDPEVDWEEWNKLPQSLSQVSEYAFRIRRWAHFRLGLPMFTAGQRETVSTYSTLDPSLYTPTKEKPYQGIWVGDYSAHGCEFLLFLQDQEQQQDDDPSSSSDPDPSSHDPTNNTIIQRGTLKAVKLTGDPNVPRGEFSFISNDIGPAGTVRIASEALFQGARVVRSRGHVAGLGFRDDTFITSQLILKSTDCVAHYWESMGHITYYRRLDIDRLIRT
ncbi:F-box protein [Aspergillus undulatus]|uniref:F-box protein n=1 Tax=Aspergillus undulatus TaxID=1810928 RepID=UPI003CCCCBA9